MSSKPIIYDAEDVSNELGQAIHDAKRKMLKEYKSGSSNLKQAATDFIDRCNYEFERIGALVDDQECQGAQPSTDWTPAATDRPPKPNTDKSGGYRLLTPVEFRFVCEQIARNLTGQGNLGYLILLFEHFAGFDHLGDFPIEGEILDALNHIIGSAPDALDRVRKEISSEIGAFMTDQLRDDAESEASHAEN